MVDAIGIRNFRWEDTDNIVNFINVTRGLTGTPSEESSTLFTQRLKMPGINPLIDCFITESNGNPTGYMQVIYEDLLSRTVGIQTVPKTVDRGEIYKLLNDAAIKHSIERNTSLYHVQVDDHDTELIKILKSEEFRHVKSYFNLVWSADFLSRLELPQGFSLREFQRDKDEALLTDLQNTSFYNSWGFSPNTVEEIQARVRMERCEDNGIIFIEDQGRAAGYNWTLSQKSEDSSLGWISMTGVDPKYRGRKLGKAIVLAGMHYLKTQKMSQIALEVDSDNIIALNLYNQLGFEISAQTLWFEKNLKGLKI